MILKHSLMDELRKKSVIIVHPFEWWRSTDRIPIP